MKALLTLICFTTLCIVQAQSKFTTTDFKIETNGLSEEYAARFNSDQRKQDLADAFNYYKVNRSVVPVKIVVNYTDESGGMVTAIVNYKPEVVFGANSTSRSHTRNLSQRFDGVSFMFVYEIMEALSGYKRLVAKNGWAMDGAIMDFSNHVQLTKSSGDYLSCFSFNQTDRNGFTNTYFYDLLHLGIKGKKREEVACYDISTLDQLKFYRYGEMKSPSGAATFDSRLKSFMNVPVE